jgi:hypothetical protein
LKLVYVSGPYSAGIPTLKTIGGGENTVHQNINVARQHAIKIWNRGDAAICPHLNTAHFEYDCDATYEQYIAGDLLMVERCDVIYMLPNWEFSKGAIMERDRAISLDIEIEYAEGALKSQ